MAKYPEEQISAAIEAEVARWATVFGVAGEEEKDGRRRFHRANIACGHLGSLGAYLAAPEMLAALKEVTVQLA